MRLLEATPEHIQVVSVAHTDLTLNRLSLLANILSLVFNAQTFAPVNTGHPVNGSSLVSFGHLVPCQSIFNPSMTYSGLICIVIVSNCTMSQGHVLAGKKRPNNSVISFNFSCSIVSLFYSSVYLVLWFHHPFLYLCKTK